MNASIIEYLHQHSKKKTILFPYLKKIAPTAAGVTFGGSPTNGKDIGSNFERYK